MSMITNAREYRIRVRQTVKETLAHRKQVLVKASRNIDQDEVTREVEEAEVCASCNSESTGEFDEWIQCDRYVGEYNIFVLWRHCECNR